MVLFLRSCDRIEGTERCCVLFWQFHGIGRETENEVACKPFISSVRRLRMWNRRYAFGLHDLVADPRV